MKGNYMAAIAYAAHKLRLLDYINKLTSSTHIQARTVLILDKPNLSKMVDSALCGKLCELACVAASTFC